VNILKSSHKQIDLLLASEAQLLKKKNVVAVAGWLTLYVCRIFFTVITGPPKCFALDTDSKILRFFDTFE
jgi:hypothetical protein